MQISLVSLVQETALTKQYVINETVLVAEAVMNIGLEINAENRAIPIADSATSLTNRPVRCAKRIFMVTAVNTHAIRGVSNETNQILVTKTMVHAIMTVRQHFGAVNVRNSVVWAVAEMHVIERRVIA